MDLRVLTITIIMMKIEQAKICEEKLGKPE